MAAYQIVLLLLGMILLIFSGRFGRFLASDSLSGLIANIFRRDTAISELSETISQRDKLIQSIPSKAKAPRASILRHIHITGLDLIYAGVMIVGILSKEVWDNINEIGTIGINPSRLVAAFIVSPIIYSSVYSRFVQDELTLLGIAIAFQNGFFWQAIFRTAQGGQ